MKIDVEHFDDESLYRDRLYDFISEGNLDKVILRGTKETYSNRDWNRFFRFHKISEDDIDTNCFFIVSWTSTKSEYIPRPKKEKDLSDEPKRQRARDYYYENKDRILKQHREKYKKEKGTDKK